MRQTTYILGVLMLIIHYGCTESQLDKINVVLNTNLSTKDYAQDIIGDWTCYKRYLDYNPKRSGIHMDADFLLLQGNGSLVFTKDSMWYFDYPREFHSSYLLKRQSDGTMITIKNKHNSHFNKLVIEGDSLIRTIGNGDHIVLTEYYVRDTLNKDIIQLLLRDSVNAGELIGRWELETHIYSQDGSEPYEINFPFDLPNTLVFSKGELPFTNIKGRVLKIDIEGISREFRLGFTEDENYNYHKMSLRPTDWYNGDEIRIHYLYNEIE